MTAVAVEISPRRPLPDGGPVAPGGLPYLTRPVLAPVPAVTEITVLTDMDTAMESAKCSCSAGDDVPF
ncbi:hypothetical protein [Streptomyces sp. AC512_CC834]|uniref:hypothetical protein n=1 Tax=Streptomyces sp. AC512_CC834 TaxID=2823691 RepID=UPI001C26C4D7|nr:hypothetical protein [Streptomyces sp. AC512_CC834]